MIDGLSFSLLRQFELDQTLSRSLQVIACPRQLLPSPHYPSRPVLHAHTSRQDRSALPRGPRALKSHYVAATVCPFCCSCIHQAHAQRYHQQKDIKTHFFFSSLCFSYISIVRNTCCNPCLPDGLLLPFLL